jgi:hypothetical protein
MEHQPLLQFGEEKSGSKVLFLPLKLVLRLVFLYSTGLYGWLVLYRL